MLALTRQPGAAGRRRSRSRPTAKRRIGVVSVGADLSGLALNDAVAALRTAAGHGLPAVLRSHVTGGPAFGADIANAFTDANITLLAVTASVVALLLIATYRSPVLWLAPLLVIGFADRVAAAVGTAVASLTGLSFDGATAGITSVLVFGAGTNYALLLISRYRQELSRHSDHRDALRRAVRMAGPAIVASNATVVLALLTLLFASTPSTRSLGAMGHAAWLSPRCLFWWCCRRCSRCAAGGCSGPSSRAPMPAPALDSGPWHRVAEWVARRPALVAAIAIAVLAVLATGLLGTRIGLSQTEQFRVRADSVSGYDVVADALSGWYGKSHARRRPHRPGGADPAGDRFHPRRGLGVGGGPFHGRPGADEVVRRHRRSAVIETGHSISLRHCGIRSKPLITARWWAVPTLRRLTSVMPLRMIGGC